MKAVTSTLDRRVRIYDASPVINVHDLRKDFLRLGGGRSHARASAHYAVDFSNQRLERLDMGAAENAFRPLPENVSKVRRVLEAFFATMESGENSPCATQVRQLKMRATRIEVAPQPVDRVRRVANPYTEEGYQSEAVTGLFCVSRDNVDGGLLEFTDGLMTMRPAAAKELSASFLCVIEPGIHWRLRPLRSWDGHNTGVMDWFQLTLDSCLPSPSSSLEVEHAMDLTK